VHRHPTWNIFLYPSASTYGDAGDINLESFCHCIDHLVQAWPERLQCFSIQLAFVCLALSISPIPKGFTPQAGTLVTFTVKRRYLFINTRFNKRSIPFCQAFFC